MFDKIVEIDQNLFLALNFDGGPLLNIFFWIVTSKIIWVPLYLYILWLMYKKVGLRNAIIAAAIMGVMVGIIDQTCNLFKDLAPSPRPSHTPELEGLVHTIYEYLGGQSGTASAHSAISFGVAVFSSIVIRKRMFTMGMIIWATLVAYSRIYAGMHYPTDLLLGMFIGVLAALLMHWLFQAVCMRIDRRATQRSMQADMREMSS